MVSQTGDPYTCPQTCGVGGQTGKGSREPDRRPDLAHPRRGASGAADPPHGPRPHGYATLLPSPPERSSLRAFPIGGAQPGQQIPALVTRKPGSGYGGRPRNRRLPVGVCCRGRNRPWFSRTAHLHRAGSPGGSSPLHGSLAPDSALMASRSENAGCCHRPTVHSTKRGGSPLGSHARRCFMLGSPGVAVAGTLCLPRFETRPA